jgi:BlaI family transcriptional regulator, penicillinase repressor
MARPKSTGPTERELAILRILWEKGAGTVRQVHEALGSKSDTGYTTTLKLLQIMTEKDMVERDESQRSHIYRARLSEDTTQRQIVHNMLDKAFGGSARKLVMHALSAKKTSADELAEIRRLLDELEGKTK